MNLGYAKSITKIRIAETKIENDVVRYAKKLGIPQIKLQVYGSYGNTGFPDRVFFFPTGKPVFIEFKTDDSELTEKQKYVIKLLLALDYEVFIVRTKEEGKEILDRFYTETGLGSV